MAKALLILNPRSGRGAGSRDKPQITSALANAGIEFELAETSGEGHGIDLAENGCNQGYGCIIAAGGDGTIHEVINGVLQARKESQASPFVAPFPVGSANDFAAMLGFPTSYPEIAQKIAADQHRTIDVGKAVVQTDTGQITRYFGNNVGIGFEAKVTLESNAIENMSGTALYAMGALRALRKFQAPEMNIRWIDPQGREQKQNGRTLMVSVGNSARTGGGFYLNPDANMDDGLLDMAIAANLRKWQILLLLPQAMWGKHTRHAAVTMSNFTQLQISSSHPIPVHIDGEVVTDNCREIAIEIWPGAIRVPA